MITYKCSYMELNHRKTYIIKIVEIIYEMCYLTLIENCS